MVVAGTCRSTACSVCPSADVHSASEQAARCDCIVRSRDRCIETRRRVRKLRLSQWTAVGRLATVAQPVGSRWRAPPRCCRAPPRCCRVWPRRHVDRHHDKCYTTWRCGKRRRFNEMRPVGCWCVLARCGVQAVVARRDRKKGTRRKNKSLVFACSSVNNSFGETTMLISDGALLGHCDTSSRLHLQVRGESRASSTAASSME